MMSDKERKSRTNRQEQNRADLAEMDELQQHIDIQILRAVEGVLPEVGQLLAEVWVRLLRDGFVEGFGEINLFGTK
jgi:hypothetical protein